MDNWIWFRVQQRVPNSPLGSSSGERSKPPDRTHYVFTQLFTLQMLDYARAFIVLSKPRSLLGPWTPGQSSPLIAIPSSLQNWPTSTVLLLWSTHWPHYSIYTLTHVWYTISENSMELVEMKGEKSSKIKWHEDFCPPQELLTSNQLNTYSWLLCLWNTGMQKNYKDPPL